MHKRVILYFVLVIGFVAFNFYLRPVEGNEKVTKSYKSNGAYINDLYYSNELFKSELSYDGKRLYEEIIDTSKNDKLEINMVCNENCSDSFNAAYAPETAPAVESAPVTEASPMVETAPVVDSAPVAEAPAL